MQRKARRHAKEGQKAYKGRIEGMQRKDRRHTKEGQKACKGMIEGMQRKARRHAKIPRMIRTYPNTKY